MKIKLINAAILFCALTFITGCSPKKEEPAPAPVIDKEAIKQEIQAKENEFAAMLNAGDIKKINYYADDAVSYSQNKAPSIGKQDIEAYYSAGFDSLSRANIISFTTNDVFISNDANQVLEVGSFKVVDSASVAVNSGNYMVYFEKRDGKYVSVREMSTSDRPN